MEASRKAPRLTYEQNGVEDAFDAELWGNLQAHLPLYKIYEKLSQEELFRLRLVCKDWNRAALQSLLPKPYFVTITSGYHWKDDGRYLNGIVTYDVASGQCSFKHQSSWLPDLASHVPPFEVEGLILCHTRGDLKERGVFNVHNQTWHVIPKAPKTSKFRAACGLMVDTSERPYTFKLIEGNAGFETQIFDSKSRSWSTTSSRLIQAAHSELNNRAPFNDTTYSCICNNGHVYISIRTIMIVTYSMEQDRWAMLDFPVRPPRGKSFNGLGFYNGDHNAMGVWEGRTFTTTENSDERHPVTVWELVDPKEHKWVVYARMSKKQFFWLHAYDSVNYSTGLDVCTEKRLLSCFCGGYLLVCCWQWNRARADALALFNMSKMKWKKVDLPWRTVATYYSDGEGNDDPYPWSSSSSDDATSEEDEPDSAEETEEGEPADFAEETEDFDTEDW